MRSGDGRTRMERWAEEDPVRFGFGAAAIALGSLLTLVAVLLGAAFILILANDHVYDSVGRDSPWLALAFCAAFLGVAVAGLRRTGDTATTRGTLVTFCIVAIVSAMFIYASYGSAQSKIRDYCGYGVRSEAQFDGCANHVHIGDFEHSRTNAARFAIGDLNECLADSGPLCAKYLSWRNTDYQP